MTDLTAKCPKCGMKIYSYIHVVDNCGIGIEIPDGTYNIICQPCGYRNDDKKPERYCAKKFRVKVVNVQQIKVFKNWKKKK